MKADSRRGQKMDTMYKKYFSDFVLGHIFKKIDEIHDNEVDKLVQQNMTLSCLESSYGFIFQNHNFIHSNVVQDNLAKKLFLRSKLEIPHDDVIKDATQLLISQNDTAIDRMRFKGLINGMLSVVKTNPDFSKVFHGMFVPEINAFNKIFGTDFGKSYHVNTDNPMYTLTSDDLRFVEETKEKFKVSYNRYRMLTDVLGL